MSQIVFVIHIFIVLALVGIVLLQRSEGGALGIGSGGGGGLMSGRGAASVLTRSTAILAACFFATSLGLAIFADTSTVDTKIDMILGDENTVVDDSTGEVDADLLLNSFGTQAIAPIPEPTTQQLKEDIQIPSSDATVSPVDTPNLEPQDQGTPSND